MIQNSCWILKGTKICFMCFESSKMYCKIKLNLKSGKLSPRIILSKIQKCMRDKSKDYLNNHAEIKSIWGQFVLDVPSKKTSQLKIKSYLWWWVQ